MTGRIEKRFQALKRDGRPGLVTFVTAGDPDFETSLNIIQKLPASGSDIIEIGMPFSDPMADGPAIQASSQRALASGMTLGRKQRNARCLDGLLQSYILLRGGEVSRGNKKSGC